DAILLLLAEPEAQRPGIALVVVLPREAPLEAATARDSPALIFLLAAAAHPGQHVERLGRQVARGETTFPARIAPCGERVRAGAGSARKRLRPGQGQLRHVAQGSAQHDRALALADAHADPGLAARCL